MNERVGDVAWSDYALNEVKFLEATGTTMFCPGICSRMESFGFNQLELSIIWYTNLERSGAWVLQIEMKISYLLFDVPVLLSCFAVCSVDSFHVKTYRFMKH